MSVFRPHLGLQQQAKRIALAENRALRDLDAALCVLHHGQVQHIQRETTPAYGLATPEVSVVVSLYNYADLVAETLTSIVASEDVEFEIIIVEDHATDDSRARARQFMRANPQVPMLLIAKDANEGLASARNCELWRAQG